MILIHQDGVTEAVMRRTTAGRGRTLNLKSNCTKKQRERVDKNGEGGHVIAKCL